MLAAQRWARMSMVREMQLVNGRGQGGTHEEDHSKRVREASWRAMRVHTVLEAATRAKRERDWRNMMTTRMTQMYGVSPQTCVSHT